MKVQFANMPPGTRVGANASGLFKSVELDRGHAMTKQQRMALPLVLLMVALALVVAAMVAPLFGR